MKKNNEEDNFTWSELVKSYLFVLGKRKKSYLFVLLLLFIVQFYTIIPPLILGKIVDFFANYQYGANINTFYLYTLILGVSFSVTGFIRLGLKKRVDDLRSDIKYDLRVRGFDNLVNLTLLETRKETAGEKAQKIQSGLHAFDSISWMIQNEIFQSTTTVIGILVVFLFLKTSYIAFLLVYCLGFFLIIKYFYSKIQKLNYQYNIAIEKSSGSYVEGLSNILTIKSLGAKEAFGTHIASKEEIKRKFEYKIRFYGNGQWRTFQVFNGICIAFFLLNVGRDVLTASISVGSIVIFYGYLEKLSGSASQILNIYERLISNKTSMARMMPIYLEKQAYISGKKLFPKTWTHIKLVEAAFDYKSGEDLIGLKDIVLNITNGEKIGIVGKSGSGKSTLAKILLGLFPLDTGTYYIDKVNFYDIKHDSVTKNVSLILQETEMFNLSLKENITLMRKIDPEVLAKAIKIAQLDEVIEKLPDGVNTLIGEKGYHLSGGERQRVGIARAICKMPQILILDEATSSLDTKTETRIQDELEKEFTSKTIIIIAHRVSTLKNVNKIYVMENGKTVEQGEYNHLIADKNSAFYQIYNIQNRKKII